MGPAQHIDVFEASLKLPMLRVDCFGDRRQAMTTKVLP